jgi:hypothetical protein
MVAAPNSAGTPANITILRASKKSRALAKEALRQAVLDHMIGLEVIQLIGGYQKAANVIKNTLAPDKRSRSGDFGEILATEYVNQSTAYTVPILRLRYKDDRKRSMRGDDVLGFDFEKKPLLILKTEAKSKEKLSTTVIQDACNALCRYSGRPNPSTLSFVSRRLRETGNHEHAMIVESLQESEIPLGTISHLVFTVSANDPAALLQAHSTSPIPEVRRLLAGCIIEDHTSFINEVFDAAMTS